MTEKLKQLKLLLQSNNGELPAEYIGWVRQEEASEKSEEVGKLKKREDELMKQIQEVTKQLDRLGPIRIPSNTFYRSGEEFFKNNNEKEKIEEEKRTLNTNLRFM